MSDLGDDERDSVQLRIAWNLLLTALHTAKATNTKENNV